MSNEIITKNKWIRHVWEICLSLAIPILFIDVIPYMINIEIEIAKRTFDMRKVMFMGTLEYLIFGLLLSWISLRQRRTPNKDNKIYLSIALFLCVVHVSLHYLPAFTSIEISYYWWSILNIKTCLILTGFYFVLWMNALREGKKLKKNNENI